MTTAFEIWLLLLAAHCFGDFLLQPDRMAQNKRKLGVLFLHAAIHGGMAYLILQQWSWWVLPVPILLVHGLIDFIKVRSMGSGPRAFLLDQALHLGSLWIIALVMVNGAPSELALSPILYTEWILLGAGFVAAVWGVGYFIGSLAENMCSQNDGLRESLQNGLKNGGAMIGKLERSLIFILIGVGQPAGIGFLVAAKSILRFEEAKKQPLAEYVLIGTLWSFGLAILLAHLSFRLFP
ncbi:MAG: DUF3307 domain-containing protein [Puniceicoccaceae bacterium]